VGQSISEIKTLTHNFGNELEEIKVYVQSNIVRNAEKLWDHSCDRSAAKDGYRLQRM